MFPFCEERGKGMDKILNEEIKKKRTNFLPSLTFILWSLTTETSMVMVFTGSQTVEAEKFSVYILAA